MGYTFRFIDHTADIAADVEGDSIEELFTASAEVWKQTIFEDANINKTEDKVIHLSETDAESLLVKFLDELNFLFQTKKWVSGSVKEIRIKKDEDWYIAAVISGEPYNEKKHIVNLEIKAVTFHQMEIRNINGKYYTRIVFDI